MEFMTHSRTVDLGHGRKSVEVDCLNCGVFAAVYVNDFLVGTTDSMDISDQRDVADEVMEQCDGEILREAVYDDEISAYLVRHDTTSHFTERGTEFTEHMVTCAHCGEYSAIYEGGVLVGTTEDNDEASFTEMINAYADKFDLHDEDEDEDEEEEDDEQ